MKRLLLISSLAVFAIGPQVLASSCDTKITKLEDKNYANYEALPKEYKDQLNRCIDRKGGDSKTVKLGKFHPEKYGYIADKAETKSRTKKKKKDAAKPIDYRNSKDYDIMIFDIDDLTEEFDAPIWAKRLEGWGRIGTGVTPTCRNNPADSNCRYTKMTDADAVCKLLEYEKSLDMSLEAKLIDISPNKTKGGLVLTNDMFDVFGAAPDEDDFEVVARMTMVQIDEITCVRVANKKVKKNYKHIAYVEKFTGIIDADIDEDEVIEDNHSNSSSRYKVEVQFNTSMPGSSYSTTFKTKSK